MKITNLGKCALHSKVQVCLGSWDEIPEGSCVTASVRKEVPCLQVVEREIRRSAAIEGQSRVTVSVVMAGDSHFLGNSNKTFLKQPGTCLDTTGATSLAPWLGNYASMLLLSSMVLVVCGERGKEMRTVVRT